MCGITDNCSTDYEHEKKHPENYIEKSISDHISDAGKTLQETKALQEQDKGKYPEARNESGDDNKLKNSPFLTETDNIPQNILTHNQQSQSILQINAPSRSGPESVRDNRCDESHHYKRKSLYNQLLG